MTAEDYIDSVIENIPRGVLRSQIAMELRTHIAERTERGQSLEEVLSQFGDPGTLAESYLAAVPLISAGFWRRVAAKSIDALAMLCAALAVGLVVRYSVPWPYLGLLIPLAVVGFWVYTVIAESRSGQTVGKQMLGIRVVQASGARIGLGQSLVRQLPGLLQISMIDALFALFTEKKQRAFELLSKTRVVLAEEETHAIRHDLVAG